MEKSDISRIPVAYLILGYENNRKAIIDFLRTAQHTVNWVTDEIQPAIADKIEWVKKEIAAARMRGVKCKQITDITRDNLFYCKKLASRRDELRHLDGIKAVYGVSDTRFVAMVPSLAPREEHNIQFIESDSESVIEIKQLIFDALWIRATPAQSRFDELEGKGIGQDVASEKVKMTIDRIYTCMDCRKTFIFSSEVEEHKDTTGHAKYQEYPII